MKYGYTSSPRVVDASWQTIGRDHKNGCWTKFQHHSNEMTAFRTELNNLALRLPSKQHQDVGPGKISKSRCLLLTKSNKCMLSAIELQDQYVPCVCCLCNVPENKHSMIPCICQCGRRRLLVHHPARSNYAVVFSVLFRIGCPSLRPVLTGNCLVVSPKASAWGS